MDGVGAPVVGAAAVDGVGAALDGVGVLDGCAVLVFIVVAAAKTADNGSFVN